MSSTTQARPGRTGTRLTRIAVTTGMILASTGAAITTAPPAHASVSEVAVHAAAGVVSQSATAFCPADEWLSGAAGGIIDGGDDVTLTAIIPEEDVTAGEYSVTVRAHTNAGGMPAYTVVAQAICMPGTPPADYQIVPNSIGPDMMPNKVRTAYCPTNAAGTQTRLLGTGAELRDGNSQALGSGDVFFQWINPDSALTYNAVVADAAFGFAGNWELIAYAICATPNPLRADPHRTGRGQAATSADSKRETTADCHPDYPDMLTTGVGAAAAPGSAADLGGFVFINEMSTNLVQEQATARAVEGVNLGAGDTWYVAAFNICWDL